MVRKLAHLPSALHVALLQPHALLQEALMSRSGVFMYCDQGVLMRYASGQQATAFISSLILLSVQSDARPLRLEDYLSLEQVSSPQVSPDGTTIVYSRSRVNAQEDQFETELWVMDSDGSRNRRLMQGGSDVRWSPDGSRIVYTGTTPQGSEVFVRWMTGDGSTTQITHQDGSPENPVWSPDGKQIAFMAKVPAKPSWLITLPDRPKGAKWTEDAVVIDKLHYRMDGVGHTLGEYSHIFVVPSDGGTAKQLTQGEWHAEPRVAGITYYRGSLEWTPDGKSILFGSEKATDADVEYARANLYAVDVVDGHIRPITSMDGFWGIATGPRISPDGKRIAFVGTVAPKKSSYLALQLRVIGIDGTGMQTLVEDLPGYISFLRWNHSGDTLYYVVEEKGANNVRAVSLTGSIRPITRGAHSIALTSVSSRGTAVGTLTSAHGPQDVVRFQLKDGGGLRALTSVNDDVLSEIQLGRVEEIWYASSDDTRVQGWIVYPPDFVPGKKYPLILDIHGGPEAMYNGNFKFANQDMAAHGYVVLYTNPRGSTGYGAAFAHSVYDSYPGRADYDDLMNGVDTVVKRGFIDERRMYVQGCSGGGTLTAWVVTNTDRFAAAAALCPVVNQISFAGATDIPGWAFNRFKVPFWEDPSSWLATSSIMRINRVKTPTLVMVGNQDTRTPVGQSEELYTGLKMVGVPTKLVLFNGEGHTTNQRPSNMLRTQLYLRKWYGEWRREMDSGVPRWRNSGNPEIVAK
jgi:dipeptidyl aminopeptidase/acylaminoacyl peptidase